MREIKRERERELGDSTAKTLIDRLWCLYQSPRDLDGPTGLIPIWANMTMTWMGQYNPDSITYTIFNSPPQIEAYMSYGPSLLHRNHRL